MAIRVYGGWLCTEAKGKTRCSRLSFHFRLSAAVSSQKFSRRFIQKASPFPLAGKDSTLSLKCLLEVLQTLTRGRSGCPHALDFQFGLIAGPQPEETAEPIA